MASDYFTIRREKLQRMIDQLSNQPDVNLNNKRIDDSGIHYLCSRPYTKTIFFLILSFNRLTDYGMSAFSEANWNNLKNLQLSNNNFNNKGIKYLTRATMNQLQNLDMSGTNIEANGILHLSKNKWRTLREIQFRACKVNREGLGNLIRTDWKLIKEILVNSNQFGLDDALKLVLLPLPPQHQLKIWLYSIYMNECEKVIARKHLTARFKVDLSI